MFAAYVTVTVLAAVFNGGAAATYLTGRDAALVVNLGHHGPW
jgi:hypothetical protein